MVIFPHADLAGAGMTVGREEAKRLNDGQRLRAFDALNQAGFAKRVHAANISGASFCQSSCFPAASAASFR